MWVIVYVTACVSAWLICRRAAGWLCVWARVKGIVDMPDRNRKQHPSPTPLLGGIAIAGSFIGTTVLGLGIFFWLSHFTSISAVASFAPGVRASLPRLSLILTAGGMMMLVGLRDDWRGMPAWQKLAAELFIAAALYAGGVRISLFVAHPALRMLLTIGWIVGITNAFNLLDNMDGLSCGVAILAAFFFFIIAALSGQLFIATLLACFLGSLAGFLAFNLPPARMFMGDAGSLFIGLMLGVLTSISTYYTPAQPTPAPVIIPLIILAIPLFDTVSVIVLRLRNRVPVFTADTNHISHRLVRLGMTRAQAVLFICLLQCCIGLSALLLMMVPPAGCAVILLQSLGILAIPVFLEIIKK